MHICRPILTVPMADTLRSSWFLAEHFIEAKRTIISFTTIWGYDLEKTVSSDAPPLLMFAGQWGLAGIRHGGAQIVRLFNNRGVSVKQAWVPGFGHFYPMEAPSLSPEFEKSSVLEQAVDFLDQKFKLEISE